jgi:hypothetical protein
MVEKQQADEGPQKVRVGYQHLGRIMNDIDDIANLLIGKTIEDCTVVWGEDTLTLFLSDGSSVEIIIDSIYAEVPELDD